MRINSSSIREQVPASKPSPRPPKEVNKTDRQLSSIKSPPPKNHRVDIKA